MDLESERHKYFEILNDPVRLDTIRLCHKCKVELSSGAVAFPMENYSGEYIGYICPACHPNRKWIWALWRSVFNVNLLEVPVKSKDNNGLVSRTVH